MMRPPHTVITNKHFGESLFFGVANIIFLHYAIFSGDANLKETLGIQNKEFLFGVLGIVAIVLIVVLLLLLAMLKFDKDYMMLTQLFGGWVETSNRGTRTRRTRTASNFNGEVSKKIDELVGMISTKGLLILGVILFFIVLISYKSSLLLILFTRSYFTPFSTRRYPKNAQRKKKKSNNWVKRE